MFIYLELITDSSVVFHVQGRLHLMHQKEIVLLSGDVELNPGPVLD